MTPDTEGMSKLVRYLSRRKTGKGIKRGVQEPDPKKNKHVIVCTVVLLDGTDVTIELPVSIFLNHANSTQSHKK